ncbi:hypothetical protein [Labilibaculum sp.]|uniref:hypothetical protein n=1 Tax=Labilibaculum sp. TaxID=2060723 RepID=UPI003566445B
MKMIRKMKELFTFSQNEDFVVVDLTTKIIHSMNSRDWSRLRDKKKFMIIK